MIFGIGKKVKGRLIGHGNYSIIVRLKDGSTSVYECFPELKERLKTGACYLLGVEQDRFVSSFKEMPNARFPH